MYGTDKEFQKSQISHASVVMPTALLHLRGLFCVYLY